MSSRGREVVIAGASRTPIGSFQGSLASVTAPRLGAIAIRAALAQAGVSPDRVDEVWMGNVLSSGLGQAPARQAALYGGLPQGAPATTVGKVCGSGLAAIIQGVRSILLEDAEVVVAGGMESMSNAPYLLPKARAGYRLGHGAVVDSLLFDGLWDPYGDFHMGCAAEWCARHFAVSREAQDAYARESYRRALEAQERGWFEREIAEVPVGEGQKAMTVSVDEEPGRAKLDRMAELRPAFEADGTITPASASKISDGASAVVLAEAKTAERMNLRPLARVVSYGGHAQAPDRWATAPIYAIRRALERAGLSPADVDLFEINEAFAVVSMVCARELAVDLSQVNVRGGAVALGHPIGASGARVVTTLVHALSDLGLARGVASLCLGGGEALAIVVERA